METRSASKPRIVPLFMEWNPGVEKLNQTKPFYVKRGLGSRFSLLPTASRRFRPPHKRTTTTMAQESSIDWEVALGIVGLHCPPEHVARLAGVSKTVHDACLGASARRFPDLPVVYEESTPAEDALGLVSLYCPPEDVSALYGVSKAVSRACLASKSLPRLFPPVRVDKFSSIEEVRWAVDCMMCGPLRPGILSIGLALTGNLDLLEEAWYLTDRDLNLNLVNLVGTCKYMNQFQEDGPGRDIIRWVDLRIEELEDPQGFSEFLAECKRYPGDLPGMLFETVVSRFYPNDPDKDIRLEVIEEMWRKSAFRTEEDLYLYEVELWEAHNLPYHRWQWQ